MVLYKIDSELISMAGLRIYLKTIGVESTANGDTNTDEASFSFSFSFSFSI